MRKQRKNYDKEFKMMVVNLCLSGKSSKEVAKDLDISTDLVNRWKREHNQYGDNSFAGNGKPVMTEAEMEITRLKKELKETQIERDILKKAVSIFSRSDSKNSNS